MTEAHYLYWQGVFTDLAWGLFSLVSGIVGWALARDAERSGKKRKRIKQQVRFMQRRISNLRRHNRDACYWIARARRAEHSEAVLKRRLNECAPDWSLMESEKVSGL